MKKHDDRQHRTLEAEDEFVRTKVWGANPQPVPQTDDGGENMGDMFVLGDYTQQPPPSSNGGGFLKTLAAATGGFGLPVAAAIYFGSLLLQEEETPPPTPPTTVEDDEEERDFFDLQLGDPIE